MPVYPPFGESDLWQPVPYIKRGPHSTNALSSQAFEFLNGHYHSDGIFDIGHPYLTPCYTRDSVVKYCDGVSLNLVHIQLQIALHFICYGGCSACAALALESVRTVIRNRYLTGTLTLSLYRWYRQVT
jgi:hypothetical protein